MKIVSKVCLNYTRPQIIGHSAYRILSVFIRPLLLVSFQSFIIIICCSVQFHKIMFANYTIVAFFSHILLCSDTLLKYKAEIRETLSALNRQLYSFGLSRFPASLFQYANLLCFINARTDSQNNDNLTKSRSDCAEYVRSQYRHAVPNI